MRDQVDLGIEGLSDYKEIGRGGFATVYSARQVAFDRRVAVKVLDALDGAGLRRFDRERLSLGAVDEHPNIVTSYSSGYTKPEGQPYLMMEFLSGGSLQDRLDEDGSIELGEAVEFVLPVAAALGHSHSAGIVHKDVKPANILVSGIGVVKLSDFGIAALREATGTAAVMFSLAHSPPETFDQVGGDDPRDERSDLYCLASTLFALLVGRAPFEQESNSSLVGHMARIVNQPVPAVGHASLDAFFATAMAKNPTDRYQTATQFTDALQVARSSQNRTTRTAGPPVPLGTSAPSNLGPPVVPPSRQRPPQRRTRRAGWVVIGVTAIAALLATAVFFWPSSDPGDGATPTSGPSAAETTTSTPQDETDTNQNDIADDTPDDPTNTTTSLPTEPIVFTGHTREVSAVAVLPDGRIASASPDLTVQVWDPDNLGSGAITGAVTYTGHIEWVWAVAVLPDGRIASAGQTGIVHVWDPDDLDARAAIYTGHNSHSVWALAVLPDGRIASAGNSGPATGTVHVWDPDDLDAGAIIYTGHTDNVESVAVLPDGRIASASRDGTVQIWHPDDLAARTIAYTRHTWFVDSVAVLADGRIASASADGTVHVWNPDNLDDDVTIYTGHKDRVGSLSVLADGRIASGDGSVHVWHPDAPDAGAVAYSGHDWVSSLAVLADGRIVSGGEGPVHIWHPDFI